MSQDLYTGQPRTGLVRMKGLSLHDSENSVVERSSSRGIAFSFGMLVAYGVSGVYVQRNGR